MVSVPPLKLGVLLIHQNAISSETLQHGLREQRITGLKLGTQLERLGLVSTGSVLRALAAQAGVSYLTTVDCSRLVSGPGGLSRDMVRALGLIPFETNEAQRRMKVACVARVPRLALGALRELTGWTPEPYLVSDQDWNAMLAAYGSSQTAHTWLPAVSTIKDIGDATARIARAAQGPKGITLTHARWDPYVWVRLQATGQTEDLLLAEGPDVEERPWAEPHTSH
jgi:hypothetical protein